MQLFRVVLRHRGECCQALIERNVFIVRDLYGLNLPSGAQHGVTG